MSARSPLRLVLVMLAVLALNAGAAHAERAHVNGQLIVHFKGASSPNARVATHARAGAVVADRIPAIGVEVVRAADARAALARYNADPAVELAELDVLARALHDDCFANELCLVPSEPSFSLQWGLQNDSSTIQPADTAADTTPTSTPRMPGDTRRGAPRRGSGSSTRGSTSTTRTSQGRWWPATTRRRAGRSTTSTGTEPRWRASRHRSRTTRSEAPASASPRR